MVRHGTYQSIVLRHDAEAFPQGSLLVLRRHTFFQIIDKREMRVMQRPRFFHDADADRKSTRLNSSHANESRMPSSA